MRLSISITGIPPAPLGGVEVVDDVVGKGKAVSVSTTARSLICNRRAGIPSLAVNVNPIPPGVRVTGDRVVSASGSIVNSTCGSNGVRTIDVWF